MNIITVRTKRKWFFVCVIVIGAILLYRFTTYLCSGNLPGGILTKRYNEKGIFSGTVVEPLDFLLVHQAPSNFVMVGDVILYHPEGFFPFHEPVNGTDFRFVVDSPAIGTKALYLIDVKMKSMLAIDLRDFDLRGIGEGIGSKLSQTRDSGVAQKDGRLLLIHEDIYEKVEVVVDLSLRAVVDVYVTRK